MIDSYSIICASRHLLFAEYIQCRRCGRPERSRQGWLGAYPAKMRTALALLLFLVATAGAQAQQKGRKRVCRPCEGRGVVDCGEHDAVGLARERATPFCSIAARCQACAGEFVVDCPKCDGGTDSHLLNSRKASYLPHFEAIAPLEEAAGRALPRIRTTLLDFIFDFKRLRVDRRYIDGHVLMHDYFDALVKERTMFNALLGVVDKDYACRMRLWVFEHRKDHLAVMRRYLGSSSVGDYKLLGMNAIYTVWFDKRFYPNEPFLRANVLHNAAHVYLSAVGTPEWVGFFKGGWLDAGAGHWFEEKMLGHSLNYCVDEAEEPMEFGDGRYRAAVRKYLRSHPEPLLPALLRKNTGLLDVHDHILSWSLFDWLASTKPSSIMKLTEGKKQKKETRDLFKLHLGLTIAGAEEAWRAWVEENYPLVEPRVRRR